MKRKAIIKQINENLDDIEHHLSRSDISEGFRRELMGERFAYTSVLHSLELPR